HSGSDTLPSIYCLFGGWCRSTGPAWYDDIELVPAASAGMPGPVGRAVDVVARHYARRAPADSVVETLISLKPADPALATAILQGLAGGWPEGQSSAPKVSCSDAAKAR